MAFSEVYVDPSIAADSGTGTIGDPYGDLEYAIKQTTFDTTNGTRVNIKAGTTEQLVADLSVSILDTVTTPAWVGTNSAHMVFRGYSAVAGDGGMGSIKAAALATIWVENTRDFVHFVDMEFIADQRNMFQLDNACSWKRCKFDATSITGSYYCIQGDALSVEDSYFDYAGTLYCVDLDGNGTRCTGNYVHCTNNTGYGIAIGGYIFCADNIVIVQNGAIYGIGLNGSYSTCRNNSVFCEGGAGTGAGIQGTVGGLHRTVENNLSEGFSGVGGRGVGMTSTTASFNVIRGNAVFNCTTDYDLGDVLLDTTDNETLTASPFNDAANGDFSPVDTGNVIEGSLPQVIGGGLV